LVLKFRRTPHGYKMRCPSCGAVVRLRVPEKPGAPPPAGDALQPSPFDVPLDEIDVELMAPPVEEAPEPDIVSPPEPTLPQPRGRAIVVAIAIIGGLVVLGGISGLTWWLLR